MAALYAWHLINVSVMCAREHWQQSQEPWIFAIRCHRAITEPHISFLFIFFILFYFFKWQMRVPFEKTQLILLFTCSPSHLHFIQLLYPLVKKNKLTSFPVADKGLKGDHVLTKKNSVLVAWISTPCCLICWCWPEISLLLLTLWILMNLQWKEANLN